MSVLNEERSGASASYSAISKRRRTEKSAPSDNSETLIGFLAVVVPALLSITWTGERTSQETGVLYLFPKCHLLIAIG